MAPIVPGDDGVLESLRPLTSSHVEADEAGLALRETDEDEPGMECRKFRTVRQRDNESWSLAHFGRPSARAAAGTALFIFGVATVGLVCSTRSRGRGPLRNADVLARDSAWKEENFLGKPFDEITVASEDGFGRAEEDVDEKEAFCCLSSWNLTDPCKSCWKNAIERPSRWCGQSAHQCHQCGASGGAQWCGLGLATVVSSKLSHPSTVTRTTTTTLPTTTSVVTTTVTTSLLHRTTRSPSYQASDSTLYCFALVRPNSYEVDLLRLQYRKKTGIFGCDRYAVVSNASVKFGDAQLVPHSMLVTRGSLDVKRGGVFWTALNIPIFVRVWRVIFRDAQFWNYNWTIKVDPDTVFLPLRLRHLVMNGPRPSKSVYFNNCEIDALHGPIEVMSRAAMGAYKWGIDHCLHAKVANVDEDGEDVFLRNCLDYLQVRRLDDWGLLTEKACKEDMSMGCISGKVAFHPFKTAHKYGRCLREAENSDELLPPTPHVPDDDEEDDEEDTQDFDDGDVQKANPDQKVEQDPEEEDEQDDEEDGDDTLWNHHMLDPIDAA